jgi:hypothetical protein
MHSVVKNQIMHSGVHKITPICYAYRLTSKGTEVALLFLFFEVVLFTIFDPRI